MRLIHAIGGLKVILGVFEILTSYRQLLTPGHLLLLTQDSRSPSFFDPNNFLIKLRARILPAVTRMWNSDFLGPSPPIIVRAVLRIILHILEAQGETSEAAAHAAANFPILGAATTSSRQITASPVHIQTLMDMGFPRSACEQALVRRNNNVQTAADYLMTHPEMVAAARTREAAQAERSTGTEGPAAISATNEGEGNNPPASTLTADVDMADPASGTHTPAAQLGDDSATPEPSSTGLAGTSKAKDSVKKYSKVDLDAQRENIKSGFISRALVLATDHGELVFDIRDALKTIEFRTASGLPDSSRGLDTILRELTEGLQAAVPSTSEQERSATVRLRLIALIFSDTAFRRPADNCYEKAIVPVQLLTQEYKRRDFSAEERPKWLASVLLLGEFILARSEMPKEISPDDEDDSQSTSDKPHIDVHAILRGPSFVNERQDLYEISLDILRKGSMTKDVFQSCMRLLLFLTRRPGYAKRFLEDGGLPALMAAFEVNRQHDEGFEAYAIMILRHVVEDEAVVRGIIEKHIDAWLVKPKRSNDSNTFTRDLNADACRDTVTFLEVARDVCKLTDGPLSYNISRKKEDKPAAKEGDASRTDKQAASGQSDSVMQIDELSKALPSTGQPSGEVERVMHFLSSEAVSTSTAVLKSCITPSAEPSATAQVKDDKAAETNPVNPQTPQIDQQPYGDPVPASSAPPSAAQALPNAASQQSLKDYAYSTVLLSCISELVASYPSCKTALLSHTKRRGDGAHGSSTLTTPRNTKAKSLFLAHLLSELVPTGSLAPAKTTESKKRFALSSQAINTIISLCADPNKTPTSYKDEPPADITHVRKLVLDALAKAFRDAASSSEPMSSKYGRVQALSNVCTRLLASPLPMSSGASSRSHSELSIHMAKLMLEKNFAVILTTALADIDLNYPSVQNLINAILTPLEHLTKIVTKIGKTVEKEPAPQSGSTPVLEAEVEESGEEEEDSIDARDMDQDEDEEEAGEDETEDAAPDVYRNSALGMFEGELEPGNDDYMSGSEMDEDVDDWDDGDEEMMEEEGVVPR